MPAPKKQAPPLERERAPGGWVGLARVAVLWVIQPGPAGLAERCRGPRPARLVQALWPLETPGLPGWRAAAVRDRGQGRIFGEVLSRGGAFPWGAHSDEEAEGQDRPSARHGVKQWKVGRALGGLRAGCRKVCECLEGDTALGDEGVPQEGRGGPGNSNR